MYVECEQVKRYAELEVCELKTSSPDCCADADDLPQRKVNYIQRCARNAFLRRAKATHELLECSLDTPERRRITLGFFNSQQVSLPI